MNLGAFMNPEYPIFSTTLCYLERDDAYLMLHRVKKEDDYNHDKWVGVGGKFERFESPEDCLLREVKEETGLDVSNWGGGYQFTYHRENPGEGDNYFVDVYKFIGEFSEEDVHPQEAETDGFMLATKEEIEAFAKEGVFLHYDSIKQAFSFEK